VAHHVYEEEGTWFVELKENCRRDQTKITFRYQEEFCVYGMVRRLRRRRRRRRSQATESLKEFAPGTELERWDDQRFPFVSAMTAVSARAPLAASLCAATMMLAPRLGTNVQGWHEGAIETRTAAVV